MPQAHGEYLPALKYRLFTPAYDLAIGLTLPERRFKQRLLADAGIRSGERILDLGCGTGTLLLLGSRTYPDATFIGVDPDPEIIALAQRKLARSGFRLQIDRGSATALPYDDGSFDHVMSSLVFHHLPGDSKRVAAHEVWRVLRPGGTFHLGDFGPPGSALMKVISWVVEKIGHEYVQENFAGQVPEIMARAGFREVTSTARLATVFGMLEIISGRKAA
jgi:ubiquinone/menaquinone biosynthesis C-methylase UbiE